MFFILDDNGDPQEASIEACGAWINDSRRIVKQERMWPWFVSTIFLGIDHRIPRDNGELIDKPVLFETMVFRGKHEVKCRRYCTMDEALAGHQEMSVKYFMLRAVGVCAAIFVIGAIIMMAALATIL